MKNESPGRGVATPPKSNASRVGLFTTSLLGPAASGLNMRCVSAGPNENFFGGLDSSANAGGASTGGSSELVELGVDGPADEGDGAESSSSDVSDVREGVRETVRTVANDEGMATRDGDIDGVGCATNALRRAGSGATLRRGGADRMGVVAGTLGQPTLGGVARDDANDGSASDEDDNGGGASEQRVGVDGVCVDGGGEERINVSDGGESAESEDDNDGGCKSDEDVDGSGG
jgi:hypothetical protein